MNCKITIEIDLYPATVRDCVVKTTVKIINPNTGVTDIEVTTGDSFLISNNQIEPYSIAAKHVDDIFSYELKEYSHLF